MAASNVIVLGPQRHTPCVDQALACFSGVEQGPIAIVTAGWEERESEDEELDHHLGGRTLNLNLFQRTEKIFEQDTELFQALRDRHDRLRKLQELYRLRLAHALEAAREMLRLEEHDDLVEAEREDAIRAVRTLDTQHLERLREVHAEFEQRWKPAERDAVQRQVGEVRSALTDAPAVCVAGGHVIILLNRMRLFGLVELLGERPLITWSAGAMALSERVIVFHDSPPQGPGDAEVLEQGLGLLKGLVPLPHASHRLRLDDATRVSLFARRFGGDLACALDPEAWIEWNGREWKAREGTLRLMPDGELGEILPQL